MTFSGRQGCDRGVPERAAGGLRRTWHHVRARPVEECASQLRTTCWKPRQVRILRTSAACASPSIEMLHVAPPRPPAPPRQGLGGTRPCPGAQTCERGDESRRSTERRIARQRSGDRGRRAAHRWARRSGACAGGGTSHGTGAAAPPPPISPPLPTSTPHGAGAAPPWHSAGKRAAGRGSSGTCRKTQGRIVQSCRRQPVVASASGEEGQGQGGGGQRGMHTLSRGDERPNTYLEDGGT